MGKKGKAKLTGTPDVVKFKQCREFALLKELCQLGETIPELSKEDVVSDGDWRRVALYLAVLGLLAEHLRAGAAKDYRFAWHYKYLLPTPQLFPSGYDVQVLVEARNLCKHTKVMFNGRTFHYPDELNELAEKFIVDIDDHFNKIFSVVHHRLNDDFVQTGLKGFKVCLRDALNAFDEVWVAFERAFTEARHAIHALVFTPVADLVATEEELSLAEERLDIVKKQELENKFVAIVQEILYILFPIARRSQPPFPPDVIPLAEACIFYEEKCSEEWLHMSRYLIKAFMDLRFYVAKIPEERLRPQLKENARLLELLAAFHESVKDATEAIEGVAKMPKLLHAKNADWMTKAKLEPDLRYLEVMSHLERTSMGGR